MEDEPIIDGEDKSAEPPQAPTVFGLPASPFACGLGAALAYVLSSGPLVLYVTARSTVGFDPTLGLVETDRRLDALSFVCLSVTTILFGFLAAEIVRRRIAAAKAGLAWRPPLWTALVGLLVIGWTAGPALALLMRTVLTALAAD